MPEWDGDAELLDLIRSELYTAVIGDICDELGLRSQFLPPCVGPLGGDGSRRLAGRSMPVLEADVSHERDHDQPFERMLKALDSLERDEIYVAAVGGRNPYALFGELMSIAAAARGAAGAVCEGYVRDTEKILQLGFPVYCCGSYGRDQRGRGTVLDYRVPIEIGGVRILPGDVIVGDADGVLVVPKRAEEEVFTTALAKARTEKQVKTALGNGMSASDAFGRFKVF